MSLRKDYASKIRQIIEKDTRMLFASTTTEIEQYMISNNIGRWIFLYGFSDKPLSIIGILGQVESENTYTHDCRFSVRNNVWFKETHHLPIDIDNIHNTIMSFCTEYNLSS